MGLKVRDSNVELLRILAILGVVVLHYNGQVAFSLVAPGSVNEFFLQGLEALFVGAVNLFVLISGYFSCTSNRRKAVKVFELLFQVIVFGLLRYLVSGLFFGNPMHAKGFLIALVPNNYFVILYLTLYVFSPYINRAVAALQEKQFRVLLGIGLFAFSLLPTLLDVAASFGLSFSGLYPLGTAGSGYGYSLIQFGLMYLFGSYLRRFGGVTKRGFSWGWLCVFLVSFFGVFLLQFRLPAVARAYCNPFVIFLAVSVFVLFREIRLQSRIVNFLAKGAFTGYLLHDLFLPHIGIEGVVNENLVLLLGHVILSAVGIYLICWLVWLAYDFLSRPIRKMAEKILSPLDRYLSVEEESERK